LDPLGAKGGDTDWYGYCVDDPVNRADAWGLEGEETGKRKTSREDNPYCKVYPCDDNGTMQGDYKPIEGDKNALPFLLDFSVPIGVKRYTIIPSPEVDPFVWHYERNRKQ
jgi:hypothetical protein